MMIVPNNNYSDGFSSHRRTKHALWMLWDRKGEKMSFTCVGEHVKINRFQFKSAKSPRSWVRFPWGNQIRTNRQIIFLWLLPIEKSRFCRRSRMTDWPSWCECVKIWYSRRRSPPPTSTHVCVGSCHLDLDLVCLRESLYLWFIYSGCVCVWDSWADGILELWEDNDKRENVVNGEQNNGCKRKIKGIKTILRSESGRQTVMWLLTQSIETLKNAGIQRVVFLHLSLFYTTYLLPSHVEDIQFCFFVRHSKKSLFLRNIFSREVRLEASDKIFGRTKNVAAN